MELIRRCSAYSCEGHCVCSPKDEKCSLSDGNDVCSAVSTGQEFTPIEVKDLLFLANDESNGEVVTHTPDNTLLAASWMKRDSQGKPPLWYEWSVGYTQSDTPMGIFDVDGRTWHDAGTKTIVVFTTTKGDALTEGVKYSVFVRVWYDNRSYAVFKSPGVIVQTMPPATTVLFGKNVKEVLDGNAKDVDYIKSSEHLYADWQDKFINAPEEVQKFNLFISTRPGGHDILNLNVDIPATQTRYGLAGVSFVPGVRYYMNVLAWNHGGHYTIESSDGVILDIEPPHVGIVMDGKGPHDIEFQNRSSLVSAFWYGFTDISSGIQHYKWCVSLASDTQSCTVIPEVQLGLKTKVEYELEVPIENGLVIRSEIVATDRAGLSSSPVLSNGVEIDTTPPVRGYGNGLAENTVQNPSFEAETASHNLADELYNKSCMQDIIAHWTSRDNECVMLVTASSNEVQDGSNFIYLRGELSQSVSGFQVDEYYRLRFYTSHLPHPNAAIGSKEGFVDVNGERHVFLLYTKRQQHAKASGEPEMIWHQHTYYFKMSEETAIITIGIHGRSVGMAIDNVMLQRTIQMSDGMPGYDKHIDVHSVLVQDWSSVHAAWHFVDPESGIQGYRWAIGTVRSGTQLQDFRHVGQQRFAFNSSIDLPHGTEVHVTIVATNGAGLSTVGHSDPLLIDRTPPILEVNDGTIAGEDVDFQASVVVSVNWKAEDPESDIHSCEWAIGLGPGDTSIRGFQNLPMTSSEASYEVDTDTVKNKKIYSTLRCRNGAGLFSIASSDGVRILRGVPSADGAVIEFLTSSTTHYPARRHFHGSANRLRIKWTGIGVHTELKGFLIEIDGDGFHSAGNVLGYSPGYAYASFNGLDLDDGEYQVSVCGVDMLDRTGDKATANITIATEVPAINETTAIAINLTERRGEAKASWGGVFISPFPLYYEVSVGRARGNVDVIQWQETTHTSLTFTLKTQDAELYRPNIFVTVNAITFGGKYSTKNEEVLILP